MLKTLVCDDERPALDLICSVLREAGQVELFAACQSARDAIDLINRGGIDLAIFDIEMPELTGVDAARAIVVDPKPLIVFVTAHPDYAVDAFGCDAIDYVLKPVDPMRLLKSVEKAGRMRRLIQEALSRPPQALAVPAQGESVEALRINDAGRFYVIPHAEIAWIEAAGDYSLVHWGESELAIRRSLTSLEEELPAPRFRRVHRSALVSSRHIVEIRRLAKGEAEIRLASGALVKASRSYRDVVATLIEQAN